MAPNWQYRLLHPIYYNGVLGYDEGAGVMQDMVDAFGLVADEDYEPMDAPMGVVLPRPPGNASRFEWARFAVSRGMDSDEVANMGRDQLRDHPDLAESTEDEETPAAAKTKQASAPEASATPHVESAEADNPAAADT